MAGIFSLGAPTFGLYDGKLGINDLDGTFSGSIDVPSIQMTSVKLETVKAELTGDDAITATHAKFISATVSLKFGGNNIDIFGKVLGGTVTSTGSTPNRVKTLKVTGTNAPYVCLLVKANAAEIAAADTHLFIPKMKLMDGFDMRFEYGNFNTPELSFKAIQDPDQEAIFTIIEHETGSDIDISDFDV